MIHNLTSKLLITRLKGSAQFSKILDWEQPININKQSQCRIQTLQLFIVAVKRLKKLVHRKKLMKGESLKHFLNVLIP